MNIDLIFKNQYMTHSSAELISIIYYEKNVNIRQHREKIFLR